MEKNILKTKRKIIKELDFGKDNQKEIDYFNNYINRPKNEDKIDNKNESRSSGIERNISVIKGITVSEPYLSGSI